MKNTFVLLVVSLVLSLSAMAKGVVEPMPKCFSGHLDLSLKNESVVQFKRTMPNLKKVQVFVKTYFVKEMPTVSNNYGQHQHFIVNLREDINDKESLIEVAHSMNGYTYPTIADLKAGPIYICAEYSTTDENGFPKITKFTPSKTGAMLHWTHQANSRNGLDVPTSGHPNGWIYANGKVFGRYLK